MSFSEVRKQTIIEKMNLTFELLHGTRLDGSKAVFFDEMAKEFVLREQFAIGFLAANGYRLSSYEYHTDGSITVLGLTDL